MSTSVADMIKFASDVGVIGLLVLILVGGYRKWWVWGYQLEDAKKDREEAKKDRDEWKSFALRGTVMAERAVTLAETTKNEPQR